MDTRFSRQSRHRQNEHGLVFAPWNVMTASKVYIRHVADLWVACALLLCFGH